MDSIGHTLKKAREGRQMTAAEVAHATKASLRYVQAIEADEFDVFPASIYAIGFIKLYAHSVGLNPEPLAQEFRRHQASARVAAQDAKKRRPAAAAPTLAAAAEAVAGKTPAAPRAARHLVARDSRHPGHALAFWPSALEKIHWPEFKGRCVSLSTTRLPVATWRTILTATGIACLALVALLALGWYVSWNKSATGASPAARWLQEPPAPYPAGE